MLRHSWCPPPPPPRPAPPLAQKQLDPQRSMALHQETQGLATSLPHSHSGRLNGQTTDRWRLPPPLSWLHADRQLDTLTARVQGEEHRVANKIPAVISCQMKSADFKAVCCCRCLPRRSAFIAAALGRRDHGDKSAECRAVL